MPVDLIKDPVTVNDAAPVCAQVLLDMSPRVELAGAVLVHTHGWPRAWVRACTDEARATGLAVRPLVAARADVAAYA